MRKNILLIEGNDHRRVRTLRHLMADGAAVTPCSSADEAGELVQFIDADDLAPDVIVMAADLLNSGGEELRRILDERFGGLEWVLFPFDRDFGWLDDEINARDVGCSRAPRLGFPGIVAADALPSL